MNFCWFVIFFFIFFFLLLIFIKIIIIVKQWNVHTKEYEIKKTVKHFSFLLKKKDWKLKKNNNKKNILVNAGQRDGLHLTIGFFLNERITKHRRKNVTVIEPYDRVLLLCVCVCVCVCDHKMPCQFHFMCFFFSLNNIFFSLLLLHDPNYFVLFWGWFRFVDWVVLLLLLLRGKLQQTRRRRRRRCYR